MSGRGSRGGYDDRYDDRGRGYDDRDRYDDRGRGYDDRDDDRDEDERRKSKAPWIAAGVGIVLLALVAGIVMSGVFGSDDESAAGEILLEPTSFSGEDPFSEDPLSTEPRPCIELPDGQGPPCPPTPTGQVPPPQSTSGGRPGLYGGTSDNSRCDPAQLVSFLADNPAKARAWVDALNKDPNLNWSRGALTVEDIPLYVGELTSLVLTSDTRVTNHGFVGGSANQINSVLQAGSAVLVDKYGVPRVKCYCGNPLLPADLNAKGEFRGTAWPGFDPSKIAVITPTPRPVTSFQVQNPNGGGLIEVKVGIDINININTPTTTTTTTEPGDTTTVPDTTTTAPPETTTTTAPPETTTTTGPLAPPPDLMTGKVQVTLLWEGDDDLDLEVTDPGGDAVSYLNTSVPSGGVLDRDAIPGCGSPASNAENIVWPNQAPSGQYRVNISLGGACGSPERGRLIVTVDGRVVVDQAVGAGDSVPFTV